MEAFQIWDPPGLSAQGGGKVGPSPTIFFSFVFEMTNPKTESSEIRKAQIRLYWAFWILEDPVNQR
jgi:hypothetical protein